MDSITKIQKKLSKQINFPHNFRPLGDIFGGSASKLASRPQPPKMNYTLSNAGKSEAFFRTIYFRLKNFVIPSICFEIATSLKLLAMTRQ